MRKLLFLLSILLQVAAVSVSAQSYVLGDWEDYETLDSREFRDVEERMNKGLLDISVNTTDPGFYKNIRISNVISGKVTEMVSDSIVPLSNVNVFVIESDSFIVEFHSTDANGVFSFPVSNPDNKILIEAIGYNSLILPLDRKNYDIRLEKGKDEQPYYFEFRIKKGNGKPVPLREASKAVETLDMSQFEDLGIYTIDEALNAKIR